MREIMNIQAPLIKILEQSAFSEPHFSVLLLGGDAEMMSYLLYR